MAEQRRWFSIALQLQGSILPVILPRILFLSGFAVLVFLADRYWLPIESLTVTDLTNNVACNLVLGLLLVFRTNTAYERFWEGRKAWGMLVITLRNLAREMLTILPANHLQAEKSPLQWLVAFALATKLHLRHQDIQQELDHLLPTSLVASLQQSSNPPLALTLCLSHYLAEQKIDVNQRLALTVRLDHLVEGLTSCERILRTPIPIAYAIYLKRLILIYCLFLPFSLVDKLQGWTVLAIAFISFVLLGVEEIGNRIENPFGTDVNDLPLDDICNTVTDNIASMAALSQDLPNYNLSLAADPRLVSSQV